MMGNSLPAFGVGTNHPWASGTSEKGRVYFDAAKLSKASSDLRFLLGSRASRSQEIPRDRAVVIMPGNPGIVTAIDGQPNPIFVKFMNELKVQVEQLGIAETKGGLMTTDGLPGDLSRLLTLSGFPMQPMTSPDSFNDYRTQASSFHNAEHETIAAELLDAMTENWDPVHGYRIARVSTAGFPSFTFDVAEKMRMALHSLDAVSAIGKACDSGDLDLLWRNHDIILAYYSTYRMQADRANKVNGRLLPKDRPHYGWNWATSPLTETPIANRLISGSDHPAFRQRVRLAYGLPGTSNYLIGCLMSGFRDHYLSEYGKTWTTRGPDELRDTLQGWNVVGVDVANFDSTAPRFLMHYFLDGIANKFPALRNFLKMTLHAPVFTPAQGKEDPSFWTGNPFDISTFMTNTGLPSGVSYNPDLGKFMGTFQALCIIHDLHGGVIGNVREILRHEHPEFMLKNSGDDMLIGFADQERSASLFKILGDEEHALHDTRYFVFEVEDPITYLGNAVYQDSPGRYLVEPTINSMLVNWFAPERSAGSNFRQFPGIGWFMREQHFSKSRMYRAVATLRDRVYRHYFQEDPTDYMRPAFLQESNQLGTLSDDDMALIEKPERLYYTDVGTRSSTIADIMSAKVPADAIRAGLSAHYNNGVIL